MSNQSAHAGDADAQQHFLASQVNLFLFDLRNEATEHGFRNNLSWNLQLSTEAEIMDLKRYHDLVVSLRLQPNLLLKAYQQVKSRLQQSVSTEETAMTARDIVRQEKKYLTAFPIGGKSK